MAITKLSIRPRAFKRYGTTASRSYYGTLDKARASAVSDLRRLSEAPNIWQKSTRVTVYDANPDKKDRGHLHIFSDCPTKENTIGYVVFNRKNGTPCWTDKKGNITHRINKDGSIRRM